MKEESLYDKHVRFTSNIYNTCLQNEKIFRFISYFNSATFKKIKELLTNRILIIFHDLTNILQTR